MKLSLNIIVILFFINITYGQEKKSYWRIDNIKKINQKPMRGFTLSFMEAIINSNFHFSKQNNLLTFDYPHNELIKIDTLKSLSYSRMPKGELKGKLIDSIYSINVENNKMEIKFNYIGTLAKDTRFILSFEKLNKDYYYKKIEQLKKRDLKIKQKKTLFYDSYKIDDSWLKLNSKIKYYKFTQKIPFKRYEKYETIKVKNKKTILFDKLKTSNNHSDNIDIQIILRIINYGDSFIEYISTDAWLYIIEDDKEKFNLERYISTLTEQHIVHKNNDGFLAISTDYNKNLDIIEITKYHFFKYKFKKGKHYLYKSEISTSPEQNNLDLAKKQFQIITEM